MSIYCFLARALFPHKINTSGFWRLFKALTIFKVKDIYKNVIAARKADKDNKVYKKVVAEYQTEATKKLIDSTTNGTDIPIWDAK